MKDEPLAYSVRNAASYLDLGVTRIYELIGSGELDGRKSGGRTLIPAESLRAYIANLPKADVRARQRVAVAADKAVTNSLSD